MLRRLCVTKNFVKVFQGTATINKSGPCPTAIFYRRFTCEVGVEHDQNAGNECTDFLHVPVLADEAVQHLQPSPGNVFIDMTYGAGGHTKRLLSACKDITIYALDRDPFAHNLAKEFAASNPQVIPLCGKFSKLPDLLEEHGVCKESIDGILFDVGCSSMQFEQAERGFSVVRDGPLDMRMSCDPNEPTAADIINSLSSEDLAKILKTYGEVSAPKKIAQALVEARYMMQPLRTTRQLVMLVHSTYTKDAITSDSLQQANHVARKTFQAFRIFVNNELNEFNQGMHIAHEYLKPKGKVVTICFHSLEDRIVKSHFSGVNIENLTSEGFCNKYKNASRSFTPDEMNNVMALKWKLITKKAIVPTEEEISFNHRSRSAHMRVAAKI